MESRLAMNGHVSYHVHKVYCTKCHKSLIRQHSFCPLYLKKYAPMQRLNSIAKIVYALEVFAFSLRSFIMPSIASMSVASVFAVCRPCLFSSATNSSVAG